MKNKCRESGKVVSNEWKEANVTSVPKPGDKPMMDIYRPVSVIPVPSKCMYFNLLFINSSGEEQKTEGRANRIQSEQSPQNILLRTVDDRKKALDDGDIVATVMIDLSKALDTINHDLMLKN